MDRRAVRDPRHRRVRSSDTRESLRAYFEIDPPSIAAAAVAALAKAGDLTAEKAQAAIAELGIDTEKVDPLEA